MNKKILTQVATHLVALMVGLGIGYYSWNTKTTSKTDAKPTDTIAQTTTTTAANDTLTSKGDDPVNPTTNFTPNCGGEDFDMEKHLTNFAKSIEDQNVAYNVTDLSDCSGIFLRLMKNMEQTCSDYIYPNSTDHRDTRDLAQWFHDNKNLVLVNDIKNNLNLLRPGAVVFYGQRDMRYDNVTIKALVKPNVGIEHVGVITKITEENGVITKYDLFHGRNEKYSAGRSYYHSNKEKIKDGKLHPAYGNGRQEIVAVGYVTTKKPPM